MNDIETEVEWITEDLQLKVEEALDEAGHFDRDRALILVKTRIMEMLEELE